VGLATQAFGQSGHAATMKQSPIFLKHYDLMAWLIPCTLNFPKSQRGVLARKVQQELFHIEAWLVEAGTAQEPRPALTEVDKGLIRLRTYLRLCHDLKLLSAGQFEHVSRIVVEEGKLLGGWFKSLEERRTKNMADPAA
jgi:hypothetical protein